MTNETSGADPNPGGATRKREVVRHLPGGLSAAAVPKPRQCLQCRRDFQSEWAGERVCPKCKKKTRWRSGALRQSF